MRVALHAPGVHIQMSSVSLSFSLGGAEKNQSQANRSERKKTDSRFGNMRKWRKRERVSHSLFALIWETIHFNSLGLFSRACAYAIIITCFAEAAGRNRTSPRLLGMRAAQIQFAPPNYVWILTADFYQQHHRARDTAAFHIFFHWVTIKSLSSPAPR